MNHISNRSYFFDNGLQFSCLKCGKCCTGDPGTIYVSFSEISKVSLFLGIRKQFFIDSYLYPYGDSYSIKEHPDGRCSFFSKESGCAIYRVRPVQCRTYPFWFEILRSKYRWNKERSMCPGIGAGRTYEKEEILRIVGQTMR